MLLWDMITSITPFHRYKARELHVIYEVIKGLFGICFQN